MGQSNTLVIIPAFNEGKVIADVVSGIQNLYPEIAVVVIDDGSNDKTAEKAAAAGAFVLSHPFNMGYGAALQTGYKYALGRGCDYIVQFDGDGQHDPRGIKDLLENLINGGYDIILGSRFLSGIKYHPSLPRLIGIWFFRLILHMLTGKKIKDPTTGFQAMNRKVLSVYVQDFFPVDYPDADILILLFKLRLRVKEVPVTVYPNSEGKSMHGNPLSTFYYIFKMLLSMFITILRNDKNTIDAIKKEGTK